MNTTVQTELEKIDAIRDRMNVSYEQAREALQQADGDVIQALVDLEKSKGDLLSVGIELLDGVQRLIENGKVTKLRVKFGDQILAQYPVAFTAAAAVAVGVAALIISKMSIEVDQTSVQETPALEGQP